MLSQLSEFSPTGTFIETIDVSGFASNKAVLQEAINRSGSGDVVVIGDGGSVGVANSGGLPVVLPTNSAVVVNGRIILQGW